jgi:hypothetical protein
MVREVEQARCPFCGAANAVISYARLRNAAHEIKQQRRIEVRCSNPKCPGDNETPSHA